ncbi:uncharacterized protein LOC134662398 isoform X1 [Cydia amplana]|uniref:uncharacterized protein LOC134662398 isoform X1 n=1 Tax=Cydia amplana TaxID=1869771 RepID=UPI002FE653EF
METTGNPDKSDNLGIDAIAASGVLITRDVTASARPRQSCCARTSERAFLCFLRGVAAGAMSSGSDESVEKPRWPGGILRRSGARVARRVLHVKYRSVSPVPSALPLDLDDTVSCFCRKARRKDREGEAAGDPKLYLQEALLERKLPELDMRQLVDLPRHLDYNEWLASHSEYQHLTYKLYLQEALLERKLPELDMRQLVDLPRHLDYNEWLASHSEYHHLTYKLYLQEALLERKLPELDMRQLVDLPRHLDYNEWLASHSEYHHLTYKLYLQEALLERKLPELDMRQLVDLPRHLDYNEWLASHSEYHHLTYKLYLQEALLERKLPELDMRQLVDLPRHLDYN